MGEGIRKGKTIGLPGVEPSVPAQGPKGGKAGKAGKAEEPEGSKLAAVVSQAPAAGRSPNGFYEIAEDSEGNAVVKSGLYKDEYVAQCDTMWSDKTPKVYSLSDMPMSKAEADCLRNKWNLSRSQFVLDAFAATEGTYCIMKMTGKVYNRKLDDDNFAGWENCFTDADGDVNEQRTEFLEDHLRIEEESALEKYFIEAIVTVILVGFVAFGMGSSAGKDVYDLLKGKAKEKIAEKRDKRLKEKGKLPAPQEAPAKEAPAKEAPAKEAAAAAGAADAPYIDPKPTRIFRPGEASLDADQALGEEDPTRKRARELGLDGPAEADGQSFGTRSQAAVAANRDSKRTSAAERAAELAARDKGREAKR